METHLADFIRGSADGDEAEAILRKCVHCGFCTATCPTYQILGDELDGPRGRIYLIKQMVEGAEVTDKTRTHLDRCLTCRNCETSCPSGVQYGRLVDIGRKIVDQRAAPRSILQRAARAALRAGLTRPRLFGGALAAGRAFRPLLPATLKKRIPQKRTLAREFLPAGQALSRKMLLMAGCVQPALDPGINAATARVLAWLGVLADVAPGAGCCGAIRQHLDDHEGARDDMRRNIDAWWPALEAGVETIVMTASGCGAQVKEYGHLLRDDPDYAAKAARISAATRDLAEVLGEFRDTLAARTAELHAQHTHLAHSTRALRIAWHPPCSLQHGQQLNGHVETVLQAAGVNVLRCADSHLCCGSAGTYSILQPALSRRLRDDKLQHLHALGPELIVTANIGCQTHLQSGTSTPVRHWVHTLEAALGDH